MYVIYDAKEFITKMTIKTRILLIFLCGGLLGGFRFVYTYQSYTNVAAFPALPVLTMRDHIRWLVNVRPFDEVKAFLLAAYPNEEPISHGVGHLFGEEAYGRYGNDAFAMCDRMLNYGCYHGVVDRAIRISGAKVSIVGELKKACDQKLSKSAPCIHPIGHAAAIVSNYDIKKAFSLCDEQYLEPQIATDCWDGAMMEYINRSAPNAPRDEYGKDADPYYPCSTIDKKYLASCVSMHVSYLNTHWSENFSRIMMFCRSYDDPLVVSRCITSTGSIIGQKYFTDPPRMVEVCREAGSDKAHCIYGAIVPLLASHKVYDAALVCKELIEPVEYEKCLARIKADQNQ